MYNLIRNIFRISWYKDKNKNKGAKSKVFYLICNIILFAFGIGFVVLGNVMYKGNEHSVTMTILAVLFFLCALGFYIDAIIKSIIVSIYAFKYAGAKQETALNITVAVLSLLIILVMIAVPFIIILLM